MPHHVKCGRIEWLWWLSMDFRRHASVHARHLKVRGENQLNLMRLVGRKIRVLTARAGLLLAMLAWEHLHAT